MKLYRIKIYLRSSYITPWQSDTLMGSLCWVMRQLHGESELRCFIEQCLKGEYPFVVSDGFPGDLLPRPLVASRRDPVEQLSRVEAMERYVSARQAKKTSYVDLQEFNTIASGNQVDLKPSGPVGLSVATMHNSISRLSGSTIDGSLYEEQEQFNRHKYLSLYVRIADGWLNKFAELLEGLSQKGYGKRISVGKGAFEIVEPELFEGFEEQQAPNAVIMISNYIPAAGDPLEGRYRSFVKYGKLGGEFTFLENPFKRPVMMFKPGSVFWDDNPRPVYGRTVQGISTQKEEVVHFGCSVAVPAWVEKQEA